MSSPSSLPVDDALPAIAAAHRHGLDVVLAACGLAGEVTASRVVRHHPGSRCVIEVVVGGRRVALKCFRRDPAGEVEQLAHLSAAGFANERGPSVTVIAGHSADLACFAIDWFAGTSAGDLLARGDAARLGSITAAWFEVATTAPAGLAPAFSIETFVEELHGWQRTILAASDATGDRAASLVDRLTGRLPERTTPGLLHRSFALAHVVDLGDGIGVLDWDEPAYGPVEIDAGAFVASLAFHAITTPDHAAATTEASDAFLGGVAARLDPDAVAWATAAAGVKRTKHICKRAAPGWPDVADAMLTWTDRRLP